MIKIKPSPVRFVRKKKRVVAAGPSGITVLYVAREFHSPPGRCVWAFSQPVTLSGVPTGLRVQVDGVWLEPINAVAVGTTGQEIRVYYSTTLSLQDKPWSIVSTPTGISGDLPIGVPESGVIGE